MSKKNESIIVAKIKNLFKFDHIQGFSNSKAVGLKNEVECTFCIYGTKILALEALQELH